ncbi:MAG TPA: inorganic phosphate transporter [Candidatus Fraserbacteria bacterium]|nr:inorganic phosphate transporter [Candidatus Fraserbacteria bacterium]
MLLYLSLLLAVILLGFIFDFLNGFHDSANAIAASVSTRVLAPRSAVLLAAGFNLLGALSSTEVAKMVGSGLVAPDHVDQITLVAALLAAISWDIITWYWGLPTSSSHALLSGLVGAGIATGGLGIILWGSLGKILLALVLSPLIGFGLGFLLMFSLNRLPVQVTAVFSKLQIVSAMALAFSHGSNDAQKTMGIIALSLFSYGLLPSLSVPLWVMLLSATAMALGTGFGGWRASKTLGMRLAHLRPIHGFAAESSSAAVILINSYLGLPISTTHVIGSAVIGVGAAKRLKAVRWGVGRQIALNWALTLPACAAIAWLICTLLLRWL